MLFYILLFQVLQTIYAHIKEVVGIYQINHKQDHQIQDRMKKSSKDNMTMYKNSSNLGQNEKIFKGNMTIYKNSSNPG